MLALVVLLVFAVAGNVFALETTLLGSFSELDGISGVWETNVTSELAVRGGIGAKINDAADNTAVVLLGVKVKPLWDLNVDVYASGKIEEITDNWTLDINKDFLVKVTDELSMGFELSFLTLDNNNNITICNYLSPVLALNLDLP